MLINVEPGIYADIDINDYHAGDGLSSSGIKLLLECPKRYWHQYLSGQYVRKETPDFIFGSAVHTAILEPHKSLETGFKLKETKLNDISLIVESVNSLDIAQQLKNGNIEQSLFWNDQDTLLKTRPDFFNEQCVIEIKTTRNAAKDAFSRAVYNYGYHIQAAMQLDGIESVTGNKLPYFIFIAIEKDAPFICASYLLSENDIEQGRRLYKKAVDVYKQCVAANKWYGYSDQLEEIRLPKWALDTDLQEIDDV